MHSFWQRLNAIFFYALSVLGFLSFMAAGTSYWHQSNPQVNINLERILLCAAAQPSAPAAAELCLLVSVRIALARAPWPPAPEIPASAAASRTAASSVAALRMRSASLEPAAACFVRRKIYGAGHDQAILSLAINADLRSVFNWNVKQLFVYITAEYETEANVRC